MSDGTDMPERATPATPDVPSTPDAGTEGPEPVADDRALASAEPPEDLPPTMVAAASRETELSQAAPVETGTPAAPTAEPAPSAGVASSAEPVDGAGTPLATPGPDATEPLPATPGLRRRAVTAVKVIGAIVVVSIVLGVGAFAAATVYAQYGAVKNEPNAVAWRSLTPQFAGAAACTKCHEPQATMQDASAHVNVSCENCHGPAAAHAVNEETAEAVVMRPPTADLCVRCHATTPGRPAAFPQVDPARHYSGGECLRCHDPHSIVAVRPPIVTHPLANLPVCTTCHAPDGLKKIPAGHELVADATCLACHGPRASGGR